jgi:hypothetical protein
LDRHAGFLASPFVRLPAPDSFSREVRKEQKKERSKARASNKKEAHGGVVRWDRLQPKNIGIGAQIGLLLLLRNY